MQGATIDDVVVIESDIAKNPCYAEQAKNRYVAATRHKNQLYIYRGI